MQRTASAHWDGNLRNGQGSLQSGTGSLDDLSFSYATRFGRQLGTNPEELIASAQAGCFTMSLAAELEERGFSPEHLNADAIVDLQLSNGSKWKVESVKIKVEGKVPGLTEEQFNQAAETAKENCPISGMLNVPIGLETKLVIGGRNTPDFEPVQT
jgi:osmotically inducible protein OsmC